MNSKKLTLSLIVGALLVTSIYALNGSVFSKLYHQEMPVRFSITNVPIIDVKIDDVQYPIAIIPGSKFPMVLYEEVMSNVNKKPHEAVQWKNGKGISFEGFSYSLPKVKIGNLTWNNVIAIEEKPEWMKGVTLWKDPDTRTYDTYVGSLGRPFFGKYNILFDFPHKRVIITNDLKRMKKEGFDLEEMVKIPLEEGRGIIVRASTDLGDRAFEIDTGSTLSIIRTSLLQGQKCEQEQHGLDAFRTSKFVMNGNDFGEVILYSNEIPEELHEIEGSLGMNFLINHAVYFDYQNKVIYIEK
jgi:hypothetical protein